MILCSAEDIRHLCESHRGVKISDPAIQQRVPVPPTIAQFGFITVLSRYLPGAKLLSPRKLGLRQKKLTCSLSSTNKWEIGLHGLVMNLLIS